MIWYIDDIMASAREANAAVSVSGAVTSKAGIKTIAIEKFVLARWQSNSWRYVGQLDLLINAEMKCNDELE